MNSEGVSIEAKGKDATDAPVHTTLLVTGNRPNVMGDQAHGRRWLYVNIQPRTRAEYGAALQGTELLDRAESILGYGLHRAGSDPVRLVNEARCQEVRNFYTGYAAMIDAHPDRFAAMLDAVDLSNFDRRNAPQTRHALQSQSESPAALVAEVLDEVVESDAHIDVSSELVREAAAFQQIWNAATAGQDPEGRYSCLASRSGQSLKPLVRQWATTRGLVPMSEEPKQIRLPLGAEETKLRANTVLVRPEIAALCLHDSMKALKETLRQRIGLATTTACVTPISHYLRGSPNPSLPDDIDGDFEVEAFGQ